ncbi:hypothetical protein KA977_05130, partial [Candidatus Dependentiae bacterium]|nr:hypothetical protein [Candidatus Dependentiae bacterium]
MKRLFLADYNSYKKAVAKLNYAKHENREKEKYSLLSELCAYNRINTLTSIYNAGHGWLGASLSVAEIITNLYFDCADIKTINS